MKKHTLIVAAMLTTLAASLWVLSLDAQEAKKPEDKPVVKAVLKQADAVNKGAKQEALWKEGEAIAKKYDVEEVMHLLKPRTGEAPGLGIGPKPGAINPDGIEAKILIMGRIAMDKGVLEKQQKDLMRTAEIVAGVMSIANHQCPVKTKTGEKDPKDWKKWSEEGYKGALAFRDALKTNDPMKVKAAASKLANACNECHFVFRE